MKNSVRKKILNEQIKNFVFKEQIVFKIRLTRMMIVFLLGIPLIAYWDFVMFRGVGWLGYTLICLLELYIFFLGFQYGYRTCHNNNC